MTRPWKVKILARWAAAARHSRTLLISRARIADRRGRLQGGLDIAVEDAITPQADSVDCDTFTWRARTSYRGMVRPPCGVSGLTVAEYLGGQKLTKSGIQSLSN